MAKNEQGVASVLAFEKKLVVSDGYLYGTTWEERSKSAEPLHLVEKSVRGTISNRLAKAIKDDPLKLNAEVEKPNLQRVDACALGMNQDTLKLSFSIKVLSGIEKPSACNNIEFSRKYAETAKRYIEKYGFRELSRRYAINIANGRYLWRNRLGAEKIETIVKIQEKTWKFDAYDFSLQDFEEHDEVQEIADLIAETLSGKQKYLLIEVETYALVGRGQEVYPSEELVFQKGNGEKKKVLYQVDDVAAMHSQKLSNAIRTIDTWYPLSDSDDSVGPIAVEPYGAVTTLGKAYRSPKDKADFYTLFDKYALGNPLAHEEEEHYVMAVLVRGGVFGQSGKE